MTRAMVEVRRILVAWPSRTDARRWLRNDDHRVRRPTGRGKYGYTGVQEIVSGTRQQEILAYLSTRPEVLRA
jgi:hypothetical protein